MDDWFVQVKGVEEMMGGISYFAEKGIVSILSEESKCRLVVTVKPRAPSQPFPGQMAISVENFLTPVYLTPPLGSPCNFITTLG